MAVVGFVERGLAWNHWDPIISVLLLLGAGGEVLCLLSCSDYLLLAPSFLYSAALAFVINGATLVVMDEIRGVKWVGGNSRLCILYLAFTLAACILTSIRCYMNCQKPFNNQSPVREYQNDNGVSEEM